jgi:hypothetical protein
MRSALAFITDSFARREAVRRLVEIGLKAKAK